MNFQLKKTIIITCKEFGNLWIFYCPFCKKEHTHGKGEGMRSSHCFNQKSPLFNKDYYLVLEGTNYEPFS